MKITARKIRTKKTGNANPVTLVLLFLVFGGIVFFAWVLPPLKYPGKALKF